MIFYIIPTPIGNLNDLSNRSLKILSSLDFLVVENFSTTRKLLNYYSLKVPKIITYNDQSSAETRSKIYERIKKGMSGALVSDSGSPLISDPGYKLINLLIKENIEIVSIPGPSSILSALVASGLPTDRFQFLGFFPRKEKEKLTFVDSIQKFSGTSIFFDSPKRVLKNLLWLEQSFDVCKFDICIAKEISKLNEQYLRGKPLDIIKLISEKKDFLRGEFVLLINPNYEKVQNFQLESFYVNFSRYLPIKDLTNAVHEITGEPKNKIYKLFLTLSKKA
ncbi:MAG: 16S rRNA (cytidine(1402)-2'-O)-methyltransferase [SAR86 cluster bacterium]|nr:16S rRNA (cytidine(1402)-2'-O)-methyltransferase [SAR86 cluster bacterium]